MKISIKNIISNKKLFVVGAFVVLILLLSVLNLTFSAFLNRKSAKLSNIKVNGMEYSVIINGNHSTIINATNKKVTTSNIMITSLNPVDSKYELIYKVCTDVTCNNVINKPEDLFVEYSSKTIDPIFGSINKNGGKNIRVIVTNNSSNIYYIKLDINAGYIHNTLALKNLITSEYNEEDIIIAATINGEISTTFPTTENEYNTNVICKTNNGPSNSTGNATWNGSKWVVDILGADSGRTICNVNFYHDTIYDKVIAQGGGIDAIIARGTPNFANQSDTGIYASQDNHGTSYYYRGSKNLLNNNMIFGGYQWKIIRINGDIGTNIDPTIRLIYNGTEAQFNTNKIVNDTGPATQLYNSPWNLEESNDASYKNDAKYVGYMFGGKIGFPSLSRALAVTNQTSTYLKTILENWAFKNLKILSNNTAIFCNDRQLSSEVGGSSTGSGFGNVTTYYAAHYRTSNFQPTLKCGLENDSFSSFSININQPNLSNSIGLITADEAMMAGMSIYSNSYSHANYLYTNQSYWTMTPVAMDLSFGGASMFQIKNNGLISDAQLSEWIGVRPVITVNYNLKVKGDGSATNPFKVI